MYWIHPDLPDASQSFCHCLTSMIRRYYKKSQPLVFICIGTPSILGDCLGPVIGSILTNALTTPAVWDVYGTLDTPVHALNFRRTYYKIKNSIKSHLL